MTKMGLPLITIGIPTYNRGPSLERAINSAVDQDYDNLEIIICDNASTDQTAEICMRWAQRDSRIRYHRHASNIGAVANFNSLSAMASGAYFMWLADDDWITPNYIKECLAIHVQYPETVLASGVSQFVVQSGQSAKGVIIQATSTHSWLRVCKYLLLVRDNSGFYGLMKSDHIRRYPMKSILAGDWMLIMGMAFKGSIRITDSASLTRAADGESADFDRLMRSYGHSVLARKFPYVVIGNAVRRELWNNPDIVARSHWLMRGVGSLAGGLCIVVGQGLLWRSVSLASRVLAHVMSKHRADALKRRLRSWMGI